MTNNGPENYYRPASVDDALDLKSKIPDAVYLAGGTQVNRAPLERPMPQTVIDLREALSGEIRVDRESTVIGAFASLQDVADSELLPDPLREAAGFIPTRNVRNQATIGGNIAAGRADSYIIPVLVALAAEVKCSEGVMKVDEYVMNNHGDLILEICIPSPVDACVVVKESRSHLALPVVSAAVSLDYDQKHGIAGACIAVGCVAEKLVRLTEVEQQLVNGELLERDELEEAIRSSVDPSSDILGSALYKKYVNGAVIADAVIRCREALS